MSSFWQGCYSIGGQVYCPGGTGPALPVGDIKRGFTPDGGVICGPGMRWDGRIGRCVRFQKLIGPPMIDPGGVAPDGGPVVSTAPPEQPAGGGQTAAPGGGLDIGGMLSGEIFGIPVMWIALGAAAYFLFFKK